eukprot:jgi/Ulvmu1/3671/UM017_0085.1
MKKQASVSSARRHARERSLSSSVDWVQIEQQLHNIPEDFKSSKFNSLKRVIEILSKDKPQWALAELEQELKKVEAVIDTVVDSHHLGFNHAIENYSKILTLFNECKTQVAALRASFDEAQSRIGAVSSNLRGQWHQSMALQGSINMLKDVQAAMADHALLHQHLPKKDWLAAVPVLLRLANKLSIQEIANLGALSGVRASVRPAYDKITSSIVAEITALTFNRPLALAVPATASSAVNGRNVSAAAAAAGAVAHHARIAALLAERQDAAAIRRAAGGFRAGGTEEGDVRVLQLLEALVQLDAVDLLRDGILTAVEPQVRAAMERCLSSAQAVPDGAGDRPGGDLAAGLDPHRAFVPSAAGERVSAVVLALLVALLLIFHNCCKLYTQLAASGEKLATARRLYGRVMTGLVRREGGFGGVGDDASSTVHALAEAASADRDTVWGLLQKEIVGLFSYLIRAPFTQTSAAQADTEAAAPAGADGSQAGSQWLSNLLRSEVYSSLSSLSTKPKTRQGTISFRFASTAAGGGAAAPLAAEPSAPAVLEYRDLADAALRRLGAPSPFLVWCLYTPTVHFVREAGSLLGPRTASTGSRSVLQHFLDDFTAETMLPRLMAEAKAAAQAIISQKNAFAPSTSVAMEGGTHVLQAAQSLAALFTELSLWARAMPAYADELCAVATGALSVLDDRCAALLDGVLQQEGMLAALLERRTVAANLSAEPAVRFVQSEELFEDPFRNAESRASEDILRTVVAATDHNAPSRPQADTVRIAHRLGGIAATLLHLTRCIERVGRHFTTAHNAHHDIATSATLTMTPRAAGGSSPAADPPTLGGLNDSLRSSSRLKKLKSGSSGSSFGEGDDDGEGGGGAGPELLPELQAALPALNLPTRGHAAAASMLARTLHDPQDVLPLNLVHLAKQMRLRAGRCLATVRLLIATTSAHTFAGVAAVGTHVLGADGARDRDPRITGFIRTAGRLVEELRPQLLPHCLRYVFSDLPRVAYQSLLWTVPRVEVVNSVGLERFLQWLLLLKGALTPLTGLDAAASAMHGLALDTSEAALAAAQSYLQLLQGPVNNIVLEASRLESRGKFASADWLSLLDVPVMSRSVTKGQRLQLRQAIDSWDGGSGGAAGTATAAAGGRASPGLRDVEPGVLGRPSAGARGAGSGSPGSRSPAGPGSPAAEGAPPAKATSARSKSRISSVMSAMPWQRADGGKGTPR